MFFPNVVSMFRHPLLLSSELLFYAINFLLQKELFLEYFLFAVRLDLLLDIRFFIYWFVAIYEELLEQSLSWFVFVLFVFFQHFLLMFRSDFIQLFMFLYQFENGSLFFDSFYFSFLLSGFQLLSAHFIKPLIIFLLLQVLVLFFKNRYLCLSSCLSCIVAFLIILFFFEMAIFCCCFVES